MKVPHGLVLSFDVAASFGLATTALRLAGPRITTTRIVATLASLGLLAVTGREAWVEAAAPPGLIEVPAANGRPWELLERLEPSWNERGNPVLVVLVRHGCDHCGDFLRQIGEEMKNQEIRTDVSVVELTDAAPPGLAIEMGVPTFHLKAGTRVWIETPVGIWIKGRIVLGKYEQGDLSRATR